MRIFRLLTMALGLLIVIGTSAAWYWATAFGCGMNTTGCHSFSMPMPWEDPELFGVLGPFLGLGVAVFVVGKWVMRR